MDERRNQSVLTEEDKQLHVAEPKAPKSIKTVNKAIYVALILIAGVFGLFGYWLIQDSNPLEIRNSPFPVRTIRQEPTPDGVLILTVNYCKKNDIAGTVRTSFVSSTREIFLPVTQEHLPAGCHNNAEVPVIIPRDLVPDTYFIKFRTTYNINPIKKAEIKEFESKSFTVAHSGDPGSTVLAPQPK